MPEPAEGALPSVYQLRIVLRGISPLIWRRLLVRAEDSIADLHAALQIAFGWDGSHLHRFVIHGREYGHDSRLDPREVRLVRSRPAGRRAVHLRVRLHRLLAPRHPPGGDPPKRSPGRRYPVLTGGRRSAPPENCGGAWAFLELRQQHSGAPLELLRMFGELLDADPGQRDRRDPRRSLLGVPGAVPVDADRSLRPPRRQPPAARQDRPGEEHGMRITVQVVIESDGERPPGAARGRAARPRRARRRHGRAAARRGQAAARQACRRSWSPSRSEACLAARVACPDCGRPRRHKDARTITLRTAVRPPARCRKPALASLPLPPAAAQDVQPAGRDPARADHARAALPRVQVRQPRLLRPQRPAARRAAAARATLARDQHPPPRPATAERLEGELGAERAMFIDGCQRDWEQLPRPDMPLTVGLDGGYVHACEQPSRREGWFEVIAGKSIPTEDDGPRSASGSCRPTTPNRSGGCTSCSRRRGCRPTSRSRSSPTAAPTSASSRCTSTRRPST